MEHTLEIASTLGFCGGVQRALQKFQELRADTPAGVPVYVLHELVHNRTVTGQMQSQGAVFVNAPEEVPEGATCLIGAHGVGPRTERKLRERAARVVDATCPIVKKVQFAASQIVGNEELILAGAQGHPEAVGILEHAGTTRHYLVSSVADVMDLPELSQPVMLCQTTLNHLVADELFAALRRRFPSARRGGSICHASSERQAAVEELVRRVDLLLVIGSPHSSNANRLKEIGLRAGLPSFLVEGPEQLPAVLADYGRIGLSAGASTPDDQIGRTADAVRKLLGI